MDFDSESGYRLFIGARLRDCSEELRFTYGRMDSNSWTSVGPSTGTVTYLLPLEAPVPTASDGQGVIRGDVDLTTYDAEFTKCFSIGGPSCGGCGSCSECCTRCCPVWDVTCSGGLRHATSHANFWYQASGGSTQTVTSRNYMDFKATGPRVGLQARRYFGQSGRFSAYMKGNLSVLYGKVGIGASRTSAITVTQLMRNWQLMPVTEIETGFTGQLTCCTKMSAGYFLSAWHDAGMRTNYSFDPTADLGVTYDDANILGFDGFFLRVETIF